MFPKHMDCKSALYSFFKKWVIPDTFCLFSVFSNKQYNFYNKSMWKIVHPVSGTGIQTHDLLITRCLQ